MAQIGNRIIVTGLTGFLIIRWLKPPSPAEVGRNATPSLLTFPYDDTYVIPNLQPVVYTIQLWRSDAGTLLDQLITEWSQDASKSSQETIITHQYKVGRGWNNTTPVNTGAEIWADPSDTDINLVDQRLDGYTKDQLIVHQSGYGNLLDAEYNLLAGGGITLLNGKTFDQDVSWTITKTTIQEITLSADSGSSQQFSGVTEITATRDFFIDSTDNLYNKLCPINGVGTLIQINFPDLSLIPSGTHVTFNTHRGSQNYLRLQFDAGDTVRFMNQDVNLIDVAKCQVISLYFDTGICYVTADPSNALKRGTVASDYDATRDADTGALIYADESTGVLNKADYEGLYAFALQLSGSAVCTLGIGVGQWSYDSGGGVYPNKRKWGIDTGAEQFRVPHLAGVVAKYSSTPGMYEPDQVGPISGTATVPKGWSYTGSPNIDRFGNGDPNHAENKTVSVSINTGNSETTVKSYSQKPFIYL